MAQSIGPGLRKHWRRLRNHLHSVHAMALDSLGEMATGLALMNGLPDKMRGLLRAECRCEIPSSNQDRELDVSCEIRDTAGDVVSVVTAHWLIGPEKGN